MKKTVILGATPNPSRYAYKAAQSLTNKGHEIIPVGIKQGEVLGQSIQGKNQVFENVDTLTLYVNPQKQPEWYEYIMKTQPKRIIFNPGAENPELEKLANEQGIETLNACTLVMLSVGNY